jgi:hypothetical protein
MYPSFAQNTTEQGTTSTAPSPATSALTTPLGTPTREEDELDLSAIREDFSESNTLTQTTTTNSTTSTSNVNRPGYSRTTTSSSTASAFQTTYETAPSNFGPEGKWQPPHLRTAVQIRRYVRRCAPLLMSDAVRASDVVICNGKRMRINWREERLEDWRLQPPTYQAHDFEKEQQNKMEAMAVAASSENNADDALGTTHESSSSNAPSSLFSETSSSQDDITPLEERAEWWAGAPRPCEDQLSRLGEWQERIRDCFCCDYARERTEGSRSAARQQRSRYAERSILLLKRHTTFDLLVLAVLTATALFLSRYHWASTCD